MTAKEFEAFIQEYEKQTEKTGKQRPLSSAERFNIALSTANIPAQYKEAFDHAEENQFGQFDSLPLLLKTYLGAKKIGILREKFKDSFSLENEELKNYLREHAMDVSLRTGISVEKNSNDAVERETAKAFDTFMNTCMMQNTMMPPSEKEKTELKNSIGE